MKYTVSEIQNAKQWDDFVLAQVNTLFVQSSLYGEFYKAMGEQYWIFGIFDESGALVGGSLVVSTHARRGNFLYLPYGPLWDCENSAPIQAFFDFLRGFAKKEKYDFVRFSPFYDDTKDVRMHLKGLGARPSPMHVLAETTWMLDITPDEETLLSAMNKNHRNLIRRCEREGVRVEMHTDDKALELFHTLLDETERRHHFHRFSREYINREFFVFQAHGSTAVYLGYLPDGRLDSATIMMFFGSLAVYRHSGSLGQDKHLPTPYLVQWKTLQEAKKRGMRTYNFWGVAPDGASKDHPFFGITHYKKGFGGYQKDIVHCHDIPISKKYWMTWLIETLRSKKRGFS